MRDTIRVELSQETHVLGINALVSTAQTTYNVLTLLGHTYSKMTIGSNTRTLEMVPYSTLPISSYPTERILMLSRLDLLNERKDRLLLLNCPMKGYVSLKLAAKIKACDIETIRSAIRRGEIRHAKSSFVNHTGKVLPPSLLDGLSL